jgi:hypothetical protein
MACTVASASGRDAASLTVPVTLMPDAAGGGVVTSRGAIGDTEDESHPATVSTIVNINTRVLRPPD